MDASVARRLWLVGEPLHALTYFAQASFDAWEAAGITGFWRGYFATRAAPFGATGPALPTATFSNFAPSMVERALPSVWERVTPAAALEARLAGMERALPDVLGEVLDHADLPPIVDALRAAVDAAPVAGRALFAANAALPWPDAPVAALWHGLTCLREHRGDGHVSALVAAGLDGLAAHVLAGAAGGSPRDVIQPTRGWTDAEWEAAVAGLVARDLVRSDGAITERGRALHAHIERRTDELGLVPWQALGEERTLALAAALAPLAQRVHASGVIRQPNPMGLPARTEPV